MDAHYRNWLFSLRQWFSKCDPGMRKGSIIWELVMYANYWASVWESKTLGVESSSLLISPPGDFWCSPWDGWMASPTQCTWVWVNSGSWWWTGRPGVLPGRTERVGHDWVTELNWTESPNLFLLFQKLRIPAWDSLFHLRYFLHLKSQNLTDNGDQIFTWYSSGKHMDRMGLRTSKFL